MARLDRPNFDRIARLYRPAEYLSFGPLLERCRFFHLPALSGCRRALLFGDGDGRFLARLLASVPELRAHAIDLSPAMLRLLHARAAAIGAEDRLTTICADARAYTPPGRDTCDLVVTHFFLDCLTAEELANLIERIRPHLRPGALWLVSEFHIPDGSPLSASFARALIALLYGAFRVLTGLRVRQIPPWPEQLARAGFTRQHARTWLGGLLVSELWQLPEATAPAPG